MIVINLVRIIILLAIMLVFLTRDISGLPGHSANFTYPALVTNTAAADGPASEWWLTPTQIPVN